ncbi:hypothetical protein EVAR_19773_1 [Eumeta japonica]|uniref:Uncharacterized protein n=1 Tax=Eumeta variegata TaxID=151549 RepID=A0A4C1UQL5_EUMVA|nr:hypothetical protein EVAR_19773_1 [Eumeta japonica]
MENSPLDCNKTVRPFSAVRTDFAGLFMTKHLRCPIPGESVLTLEKLAPFRKIEAFLNFRLLCPVSSGTADLEALTRGKEASQLVCKVLTKVRALYLRRIGVQVERGHSIPRGGMLARVVVSRLGGEGRAKGGAGMTGRGGERCDQYSRLPGDAFSKTRCSQRNFIFTILTLPCK